MKSNALNSICTFVSEKRKIQNLTLDNYISTENMLQNKGGITKSSGLPTTAQTQAFETGDVLVSNIRPYFKKIWLANECGGCSNDVLVFRANKNISSEFLYYVLSDDEFFDYATKTAKGTKMPRGDKKAIMLFEVPNIDIETQKQIAKILSSIDDKIELNNKINDNLEKQAQAIFKSWFVDFEPFGGVMPSDWKVFDLESIATIDNGYSYKGKELQSSDIAMATIKNFDRNRGFKLDGFKEIIPSDKIKPSHYVEKFDILVAHTDLTQNADIIGNAELLLSTSRYNAIIASMDLVKVTSKENFNQFLLASLLKSESFKNHALGYVNGTTVLHLSKKALKEYSIYLPKDLSLLDNISSYFESVYLQIAINIEENQKLAQLRDTLLPRLMSGEIDVSKVEI